MDVVLLAAVADEALVAPPLALYGCSYSHEQIIGFAVSRVIQVGFWAEIKRKRPNLSLNRRRKPTTFSRLAALLLTSDKLFAVGQVSTRPPMVV